MKTTGKARLVAFFALSGLALFGLPAPAQAAFSAVEGTDAAAVMFNPTRVDNISLQMTWSDYNSLQFPNVSWDNEGDWRETRMSATIAGKRYGPYKVGVHLKGAWGSWRDINGKAGFKIKMDAFVPEQTLLGVEKLTLNNMVQDSSYMHEVMTYKIMRSFGVPAPRTGYTGVSLNGVDYGLHLNVETLDDRMLKRWNVSSKHLYKGALPYFPDFNVGSDWQFKVETGDPVDTSDLSEFMSLNQLRGDQWWNEISQKADMDQITRSWAVEIFSGHWDGYLLNNNNYFVNFDNEGKVSLLPWGVDQTWGGNYDYFSFRSMLPNKCLGSTDCTELYMQNLAKLAHLVPTLNLYEYTNRVGTAISAAIDKDRFSFGSSQAQAAQRNAYNRFTEESAILSSLVVPWDTTIANVTVNGSYYKPGQVIYLAPELFDAVITVNPSQSDATADLTQLPLKAGLNTLEYSITSANSLHTNVGKVQVYLLSNKSSKVTLQYEYNSLKLKTSSAKPLKDLTAKLKGTRKIEITFGIAQSVSRSQAEGKIKQILQTMKTAGITPKKVTKVYLPGTSQAIKITAGFQN